MRSGLCECVSVRLAGRGLRGGGGAAGREGERRRGEGSGVGPTANQPIPLPALAHTELLDTMVPLGLCVCAPVSVHTVSPLIASPKLGRCSSSYSCMIYLYAHTYAHKHTHKLRMHVANVFRCFRTDRKASFNPSTSEIPK